MYTSTLGLVLGFHGCDQRTAENVVSGKTTLNKSENTYDWLGHGIYFWENDPSRALEYARSIKKHPERARTKIEKPAVLGAVISLGHCLNLLEARNLQILQKNHQILQETFESAGTPLPENTAPDGGGIPLSKELDCAVLLLTHALTDEAGEKSWDSVRGVFIEGEKLYENAGFNLKNHIQVCVRNSNCIKGYFLPRRLNTSLPPV